MPSRRADARPAPSGNAPARLQERFRLAVGLHQQGRFAEAESAYRRLLKQTAVPQPRLLGRLAQARLDQDDAEEARQFAAQSLALAEDPLVLQIHGVALRRLQRQEEALPSLRRAAELAPDDSAMLPAALQSLSNVLADLGRYEEAEAVARRALRHGGRTADVLATLALALRCQGRPQAALIAAEEAVALEPERPGSQVERAMALLTLGRWREGFEAYRWRLRLPEIAPPSLSSPPWQGEPIKGQTLLLYPEQGLGDMIQFARFAPLLAEQAERVVLVTRRPLVRLFDTLPSAGPGPGRKIDLVPEGSRSVAHDRHAALMSVPELLGLDPADLPTAPYLRPEPERVERWRARARLDRGFTIGIAWQGKPTSRIDAGRSFALAHFAPLAALPEVRLIGLQKEHGLDQLARLPPGMVVEGLGPDFDAGPDAFLDTAAVMASLDLVITSDTATAHLAGALGRPVWTVLRYGADWRWLTNRADSPWYPTMRLFRQPESGDWAGAFAAVAAALKERLAGRERAQPRIPVSWGELIDKITILEIKAERIADPAKLGNVRKELRALAAVRDAQNWRDAHTAALAAELRAVNEELWRIEDAIRAEERAGAFGPRFVELARAVYTTNDRRAALKRDLNTALGSALIEEKSYG